MSSFIIMVVTAEQRESKKVIINVSSQNLSFVLHVFAHMKFQLKTVHYKFHNV
jgi:hypothetical protein